MVPRSIVSKVIPHLERSRSFNEHNIDAQKVKLGVWRERLVHKDELRWKSFVFLKDCGWVYLIPVWLRNWPIRDDYSAQVFPAYCGYGS